MARKRKAKPTSKRRNHKQKVVENHQKWREEAQLIGAIPTTPEGAVRDERVDPSTQGSQPLPGLIGQAVRKKWATPDHMAIRQVDELHQIATDEEVEPHIRVQAIRTAQMADRDQWERENPDLAGKVKGGTKVEVNTQQTVNILDLAREAAARPDPLEQAKAAVEDNDVRKPGGET